MYLTKNNPEPARDYVDSLHTMLTKRLSQSDGGILNSTGFHADGNNSC